MNVILQNNTGKNLYLKAYCFGAYETVQTIEDLAKDNPTYFIIMEQE